MFFTKGAQAQEHSNMLSYAGIDTELNETVENKKCVGSTGRLYSMMSSVTETYRGGFLVQGLLPPRYYMSAQPQAELNPDTQLIGFRP